MTNKDNDIAELQSAFFRAYSNVPLNLRSQIVIVVDGSPITWDVAYIEINSKTAQANNILQGLRELSII